MRSSWVRIAALTFAVVSIASAGVAVALTLSGDDGPVVARTETSPTTTGGGATETTIETTTEPLPTTTGDGPTTTTPETTNAVQTAVAQLQKGRIVFNAPNELKLGEQVVVRLLLSRTQSIEELRKQISEIGREEGAEISVSDVMEAELSGLDFRIDPPGRIRQSVGDDAEWEWTVEPTRVGTRMLVLRLWALISLDGDQEPYRVKTFRRSWTVDVTWPDRITGFVEDNWQWLWTAILVPIAGLLWRRLRRQGTTR